MQGLTLPFPQRPAYRRSFTISVVAGLLFITSPADAQSRSAESATGSRAPYSRLDNLPAKEVPAGSLAAIRSLGAGDPIGTIDQVAATAGGQIQVVGWAADPRAPGLREEVHVYVTGPNGVRGTAGIFTGAFRPDVAAALGWTGSHQGFTATVPASGTGLNTVCVFAINVYPPATNPNIGCKSVNVQPVLPVGHIDSIAVVGTRAIVGGWTFDPSRVTSSIPVHIYVTAGSVNNLNVFTANLDRPDVNRAFSITGRHGFSATVSLGAGSNRVCAYGIGQSGNNGPVGTCSTVQANGTGTPASSTDGKPGDSNTGVIDRASLKRYTGPLTITKDSTVIDGYAVYGDLRIQARNVIIRNSYLHCGSEIPKGNSGCIDANSAEVYNLVIENNLIVPDAPSYYRDGIVGHEFTAIGNNISRTNDGIGIFNRPGGSPAANVTVEGNYIHDLTHWNNDPAHADGTHNDAIQVQGGQNIFIRRNNLVGSVVAGDGLGRFGRHGGAALLVNQNTVAVNNLIIENNWLDDAQNSVCINNGKYPEIHLTLQNNWLGRNQYDFGGGSKYPIRIYSRYASRVDGLMTNRWADTKELLTEGKTGGIRYNG